MFCSDTFWKMSAGYVLALSGFMKDLSSAMCLFVFKSENRLCKGTRVHHLVKRGRKYHSHESDNEKLY
jgi:hypothetical protein